MAANTQSYSSPQAASTPTRSAPRPTLAPRPTRVYPSWSLCQNCGGEYYPEDIPAALRDCGQYGTCGDCREQAQVEMAAWAVGVWS